MANPFLFTEEPANAGNGSAGFNPFLSGGDLSESGSDNPFMSSFGTQGETYESSSATNPFAFGDESETNFFQNTTETSYDNIFSTTEPVPSGVDFFGSTNVPSDVHQKPTDFGQQDLSSNVFSSEEFDDKAPPRRPPPPRPGPPKETKDLILSVTGAMEATSSHLLDRLQATRTPSPTPMRDLHSPSPTQFGDLLEVDGPPAPPPTALPQEGNLLGDFDFTAPVVEPMVQQQINIETSSVGPMMPPIEPHPQPVAPLPTRPAPPVIPERPKPPVMPARPPAPVMPPRPVTPEIKVPEPIKPDAGFADVFGTNTPEGVPVDSTQSLAPSMVDHDEAFTSDTDDVFTSATPEPEPSFPAPKTAPPPFPEPVETKSEPGNDFGLDFTVAQPAAPPPRPSVPPIPSPVSAFSPPNVEAPAPATGFSPPTTAPTSAFSPPTAAPTSAFSPPTAAPTSAFSPPTAAPTSAFSPPTADPTSAFSPPTNAAPVTSAFSPPTAAPTSAFSAPVTSAFSPPTAAAPAAAAAPPIDDDFDAFSAKFDSFGLSDNTAAAFGPSDPFGDSSKIVASDPFDPFASGMGGTGGNDDMSGGFGADDNFDSFLSLRDPPPVPQGTPARVSRAESAESNDGNEFNIFIKPKANDLSMAGNGPLAPALAPPPKSPSQMNAFQDSSPRFNPFDNTAESTIAATENIFAQATEERAIPRTDSQETPPTPLFDEDVSQPLEDFPRIHYAGPGWEMMLRQPNKKKITGQRFWKKIFMKLVSQGENPVLQLFNGKDDKDPFQELPLQPCYSVSEIGAQQFDQYGKIFTVKLQFIFYKERPGVRPGQVTKAERITNKLSQFAAYAIQGDYQGVKEFGSDLKKLGLPVEHAPQISQLFKIGSQSYEDMKQFSMCIEEALFRLPAHRDRALTYKMEEVQITTVDELYVEQNATGGVEKQIARVRLFFLGFLSGMPDIELGVNDMVRQGKEVVGRHDIIPVVTEEWIRLEAVEFHSCVQQDEYGQTRTIKFKPPDAMYIELMRFRVRPPRNRELPLQVRCTICVTGNKVEIHGDILVPGFTSRKLGQIPCEDVMVRIPIPECWIYQFRVEKHFRYGSVKSAHRRTGKVKGIERFLGAIENMEPSLMEVTSGQAKYEHQHRAIVWRMPRLPKEGQGAYTTHNLVVRLQLTSYDQIPEELAKYCYVEFTMPATTVSHTTVRSVSIGNSDSDTPPEKYVRHLSRHEYRVEIEHTQGETQAAYIAATTISKPAAIAEEPKAVAPPPVSDSDSDSG